VTQGVGPEFKPQYHKKREKKGLETAGGFPEDFWEVQGTMPQLYGVKNQVNLFPSGGIN
jgi:hypothetical protein